MSANINEASELGTYLPGMAPAVPLSKVGRLK